MLLTFAMLEIITNNPAQRPKNEKIGLNILEEVEPAKELRFPSKLWKPWKKTMKRIATPLSISKFFIRIFVDGLDSSNNFPH